MLQYPSITKQIIDVPIYAMDKLDGSNIRVEWSRKSGFNKFGSRTRLLDPEEKPLGEAVGIFMRDMAEDLETVLRTYLKTDRATLFLEFYGPNSFAGNHQDSDEKVLSLFDVSLYKKGFMLPKEFLRAFEGVVLTPELLYTGKPNSDFIESVHDGELDGMTFEGVVCKSQELRRNQQVVFKVKNDAWLQRLRDFTKGDGELFKRLA